MAYRGLWLGILAWFVFVLLSPHSACGRDTGLSLFWRVASFSREPILVGICVILPPIVFLWAVVLNLRLLLRSKTDRHARALAGLGLAMSILPVVDFAVQLVAWGPGPSNPRTTAPPPRGAEFRADQGEPLDEEFIKRQMHGIRRPEDVLRDLKRPKSIEEPVPEERKGSKPGVHGARPVNPP